MGCRKAKSIWRMFKEPTPEQRQEVREFHCGFCAYCLCPLPAGGQIDHIVPAGRRGTSETGNLALSCRSCNAGKHDHSLLQLVLRRRKTVQWGVVGSRKPISPPVSPRVARAIRRAEMPLAPDDPAVRALLLAAGVATTEPE